MISFEPSLTQPHLPTVRRAESPHTGEDPQLEHTLFRELLDNSPDYIYFKDKECRFVRISRSLARLFGLSNPIEAIGKTDADYQAPALAQAFLEEDRRLIQTGYALHDRLVYNPASDGHPRWFADSKAPIYDAQGQVIGLVGIGRNVTQRILRERAMQAIAKVSDALRPANTRGELVTILLDQVMRQFNVGAAAFITYEADQSTFVESARGSWAPLIGQWLPAGKGLAARVIATGQAYVTDNIRIAPNLIRSDVIGKNIAVTVVPLSIQGNLIGALAVGRRHSFDASEVYALTTIGDMATNIIHRTTLHQQAERQMVELERRKLAETLGNMVRALNSTLDLGEVLERLLDSLKELVPYDGVAVLMKQDNALNVVRARGFADMDSILRLRAALEQSGFFKELAASRHAQLIADIHTLDAEVVVALSKATSALRAWLGVPLIARDGSVVGILMLINQTPGAYTEYHAEVAFTFASQAMIAIENARLFGEVHRLATTDGLTGVFNRRHFFDLAEREAQRAQRTQRVMSAIMLDIDHFKKVNDTYGHAAGDEVLRMIAQRCRENLRVVDILGRYGGEEFAIILPETDLTTAHHIAERLRQRLTEKPIITDRLTIAVTISLGVSAAESDTFDVAALLNQADAALYQAKQAGRNRVMVSVT
jgi:diguanylate cyclase (GGDEF)-like protein/PAS domain S-box-containing protein